jgi:hypothetical protein
LSDIIFGKETLFILDEDLNVNKSDLLFKKPKVDLNSTSLLENEQNLNKISIKNNYKDYDDDDVEESDDENQDVKNNNSKYNLAVGSHFNNKLRSSRSSPKIFDEKSFDEEVKQQHRIPSSKSTQFISLAESNDTTNQF